jgi:hypothetical protein
MSSPYQEFARKARERFQENQKRKVSGTGAYQFTRHAEYKMRQYGLSGQRVKSVILNPKRREEGIVPKTVAVMQPVSMKKVNGKDIWKQEIWVMFQKQGTANREQRTVNNSSGTPCLALPAHCSLKIISAWRYPGVSPKRHPIPEEILRELEEGSIIEAVDEA